jgi:Gly-Xaa carboxypeptidase
MSSDLKPVVFAAHQDVVPTGDPAKWTHSPFKAYFDGEYLWGRGASDCKNNLIGLLSVLEELLSQSWRPKRTVILAFGFDEEVGGTRGAAHISALLEKRYGRDGIDFILDEGGMGLEIFGDSVFALPAVAEKGYLDVFLELRVEGGHSSTPPPHSGIGIMSALIVELEKHPFQPRLTKEIPYRGVLECQICYSKNAVEPWLSPSFLDSGDELELGNRIAESRGDAVRYSLQTSQSITIIQGGEKSNQLPDYVRAVVNYRIAPHESVATVKQSIEKILWPAAEQYNLDIESFGKATAPKKESRGQLTLTSRDDLEPAPLTPTSPKSKIWSLFAGTIRQVFEKSEEFRGRTVIPVGDIMTGEFLMEVIFVTRQIETDWIRKHRYYPLLESYTEHLQILSSSHRNAQRSPHG